ncbi:dipeptidase [Phenylobacterium sp.]|uniref:dipeptidase n=2 Tax=Phenylobacterium sp. TaxID=1871053 RepID=UPI0027377A33|nr:dipeptidase [Phenylobacterium sp.]MDP3633740.1 dipeptidase [Phenylobacterium sp.]MDP3870218.1 dipeptidase [Phenylobacterium sp.]
MHRLTVPLAILWASCALPALSATPAAEAHKAAIVLDTHFDTPANFHRPGWDIMDRHSVDADGSQVDYPRMVEGGVDGGFFAIFTPQGARTPEGDAKARDAALLRAVEIHQMVAKHGAKFALATRAEEAAPIVAAGKKVVFISMENSQPVEADLTLMATFYTLGVRMMGPIHFMNNDLGDSSTDPKGKEWNGLSAKGKSFVAEANRLGVVLDASHASDEVLDQMIALSTTPLILSHSGLKAIFDHPRNIDDTRLKALAAKGGVIQINAFSNYMVAQPKIPERDAALADLMKSIGASGRDMTPAQRKAFLDGRKAIDAKWPMPRANLDDFMKHMLHAIEVAGIDHVGVSGDFDGGGGIAGLEDVTDYPRITERLIAAGYSRDDVAKVWGGNALRVLKTAADARTAK